MSTIEALSSAFVYLGGLDTIETLQEPNHSRLALLRCVRSYCKLCWNEEAIQIEILWTLSSPCSCLNGFE